MAIKINPEKLEAFMQQSFMKLDVPEEDAATCANVLITSDLRGIESHGIGRLRMYVERIHKGLIEPIASPTIVKESPTTALIDGQHGIGMVIGHQSMELAIEKAKVYGMGSVAVRNSTHFGIDGYYPLMAIKAGMLGMSFTNARPSVAPTFSTQPAMGTNPIAFGVPTDEDFPFLFDAATSITQRGKIEVANRKEIPIHSGWVIDDNGNSMNDPSKILKNLVDKKAALLPLGGDSEELGGHKGYGLSVMVEIFSSALQSGAFLFGLSGLTEAGEETRFRVGHFFMVINIENFLPVDEFKANVGNLLRELRSLKKAPGQDHIYTAGEKEYLIEKRIRSEGIPINKNLKKDLIYIQDLLGLNILSL